MSEACLPRTGIGNEPWVEVTGSPRLWSWLAEQRVSLAFTTYQTGKLFLLGRHPWKWARKRDPPGGEMSA
jgi:hypothetical protein